MIVTQTSTDPILSIISNVKASEVSYQTVKDESELGKTFHEAGRGLSLINEALSKVRDQLSMQSVHTATPLPKSCNATAASLKGIFEHVSKTPAGKRRQVYVAYIQKNDRGNLVEALVIQMMEDVCEIATSCSIEVNMQALEAAIENLKKMEPSTPVKQGKAYHFENHGAGNQFNAPEGTQNNAVGPAPQFVGSNFPGSVHFGSFD